MGALYSLVETTFQRVKKINKTYLRLGLPHETDEFNYLIPNIKSEDFSSIEQKWKIRIPFNKEDLIEYKI